MTLPDLSIFLTKQNILFFVIFGLMVLIVLAVFFIIVRFIVRFIISILKRIFHKKPLKRDEGSNLDIVVKELEESKEERAKIEQQKAATATTGGPKLGIVDYSKESEKKDDPKGTPKSDQQKQDEKQQKDILDALNKLKGVEDPEPNSLGAKIKISTATTGGPKIDYADHPKDLDAAGKEKLEEAKQKDIAGRLGDLKAKNVEEKDTLESKMPSRFKEEEDSSHKKIEIPVAKKIGEEDKDSKKDKIPTEKKFGIKENVATGTQSALPKSGAELKVPVPQKSNPKNQITKLKEALTNETLIKNDDTKERAKAGKKFVDNSFFKWVTKIIKRDKKIKEEEENKKKEIVSVSSALHGSELVANKEQQEAARKTVEVREGGGLRGLIRGVLVPNENPSGGNVKASKTTDKQQNTSIFGSGKKQNVKQGPKDNSIFEGKEEISRISLRQKLRGAGAFQAEKQVGLTLSPIERAKLEKEVFSSALGYNISKQDLKGSIKKLNNKMLGSSNMAEKGKLRKEIKFFKKLGGIK